MIKYYDTHSHLNMDVYDNEIEECIKQLKENQTFTNCVAYDFNSSVKAVELSKKYSDCMKACVGIHPNDIEQYFGDKDIFNKLDNLITNNRNHIVGIGEIGLDFYYSSELKKEQIHFCIEQIKLGVKHNLPIMFHLRNAFEDIKPIIENFKDIKKLIHCFSSNLEEAKYYVSQKCFISIPGIVTFKNALSLKEAVQWIDINCMVTETDSPYLTPVPFRGKQNYPHYVKHTVEEIAKLKNLEVDVVSEKVLNNAKNFFGINF
ncbi:TatD family deoxyribonuclease [Malacoplasma penetrans]|uniref:Uncharacterized protein n=1 Tax=Malacoplasma penetrans (strain HF-2) TaxID=272633 RepID=Q8EUV7_MALP2|nr:TatD family hydrolase [Malacoplasma penetrans]RXY96465.1 TatD family deoxyribonuclease [Malacoplasma penetrans]BAC44604.1 conserved hypothetical protein [Malacoplasma penetrans HF-2]